MKLDSRQLRYFVAVAEELHFGRAAERLHMSQPPLSQQIRQLEAQLGVQLFERSPRGVQLLPAGEVLLAQAHSIHAELERTVALVQSTARGDRGLLRLGYTAASAFTLLPSLIRAFKKNFPGVEVVLMEMLSSQQAEALAQKRLDVGLLRPFRHHAELCTHTLVQVTLPPKNVPLAECFNTSKGNGNDEDSAGALHAGIQAGGGATGARRPEHRSGGQNAGGGRADAVQLGQG